MTRLSAVLLQRSHGLRLLVVQMPNAGYQRFVAMLSCPVDPLFLRSKRLEWVIGMIRNNVAPRSECPRVYLLDALQYTRSPYSPSLTNRFHVEAIVWWERHRRKLYAITIEGTSFQRPLCGLGVRRR